MPRSAYPMALDAAPQDGRWLDDPKVQAKVITFLLSKLSPADLAELDDHLVDGTEPQATDHRIPEGDLKHDFLRYTPRNRRGMVKTFVGTRAGSLTMDAAERDAIHAKLFPNADRLK